MTNEELNTAVYDKAFSEQERFRSWLLSQPPEEILNHCYEYTVREDILVSLEFESFSDKQCQALLKPPDLMSDVFADFSKLETGHMQNILTTIESRANAIIRKDFAKTQNESR